jgi:hypothetical protein
LWRTLSFLAEFGRVNHRMHNKLFVMDNAVGDGRGAQHWGCLLRRSSRP